MICRPHPWCPVPGACTGGRHLWNTRGFTLRSYEVNALPLISHLRRPMRLEEMLRQYPPPDDPPWRVAHQPGKRFPTRRPGQ